MPEERFAVNGLWRRYARSDLGVGNIRPSGAGYSPVEQYDTTGALNPTTGIWQWGAGKTLQGFISGAGATNVTFPPGTFEWAGFQNSNTWGILETGTFKGISGSGNDPNSSTFTRFRMTAGTASATSIGLVPIQSTAQTNPLYLMRFQGGSDQIFQNFWLEGTNQPNDPHTGVPVCHNGMMFTASPAQHDPTVKNVYINGIRGDAGSQPGETFGINLFNLADPYLQNVEVSGLMTDGTRVGSSPIGLNSVTATPGKIHFQDCYLHHAKIGQFTHYQTKYTTSVNMRSEFNTRGFNHERTLNITHINPVAIIDTTLAPNGMHFAYANPQLAAWPDATGNVIQNPTHPGDTHLDGKLAVMVQDTYAGAANQQTSLPIIKDANGNVITFTSLATRYH
jgi:hypothetical protein